MFIPGFTGSFFVFLGLFQRGISHSGSAYCPWASHAPGQLRLASERFASQLGCNHHSTHDTLDCLRVMPAYVLVDIASSLYVSSICLNVTGFAITGSITDTGFICIVPCLTGYN